MHPTLVSVTLALLVLLAASPRAAAQVENSPHLARNYAQTMLRKIHGEVTRNYYDPTFNGADLDAELVRASEYIERSSSPAESFRTIASYLMSLNDSHTAFMPPAYADDIDYGFDLKFIGDTCYVSRVAAGTPAAASGLQPGDRVLRVQGERLERHELSRWIYLNTVVSPIQQVVLQVQTGTAAPRRVVVTASMRKGRTDAREWQVRRRLSAQLDSLRESLTHYYGTLQDSVLLWRMPSFSGADRAISRLVSEAGKHSVLVLDLRDNTGGARDNMTRLIGALFDRDVTIGSLQTRKKAEPMLARAGKKAFGGRVIVIVDSESASAAEVFARVMQIEQRGTVIGDRTAGAVLASRFYGYSVGVERIWYYGAVIAAGKLLMTDGGQLEGVGVSPDVLALPSGADLATGRDPVLSHALELAGVTMTPEQAGRLSSRGS